MCDADGFQLVQGKKKKTNPHHHHHNTSTKSKSSNNNSKKKQPLFLGPLVVPLSSKSTVDQVQRFVTSIQKSEWYQKVKELAIVSLKDCGLSSVGELVCYGIGSLAGCETSRQQMALALLLLSDICKENAPLFIFDPVFGEEDVEAARILGCTPITTNEKGVRSSCSVNGSMFFMPHCGRALYDAVLRMNWGGNLQKTVIVGNSFGNYMVRPSDNQKRNESCCLIQIEMHTRETPLPKNAEMYSAFNDTSIHTFGSTNGEWPAMPPPIPADCADEEIIGQ